MAAGPNEGDSCQWVVPVIMRSACIGVLLLMFAGRGEAQAAGTRREHRSAVLRAIGRLVKEELDLTLHTRLRAREKLWVLKFTDPTMEWSLLGTQLAFEAYSAISEDEGNAFFVYAPEESATRSKTRAELGDNKLPTHVDLLQTVLAGKFECGARACQLRVEVLRTPEGADRALPLGSACVYFEQWDVGSVQSCAAYDAELSRAPAVRSRSPVERSIGGSEGVVAPTPDAKQSSSTRSDASGKTLRRAWLGGGLAGLVAADVALYLAAHSLEPGAGPYPIAYYGFYTSAAVTVVLGLVLTLDLTTGIFDESSAASAKLELGPGQFHIRGRF